MFSSARGNEESDLPPGPCRVQKLHGSRRIVATAHRRLRLVAVLLLVCVAFTSTAAAAQTSDDPETQRQQNEQRRKEIAGELDVLKASDEQLKAELDRLDVDVHDNETKASQARSDLDAARAEIGVLDRQVVDAEQAAQLARQHAADRAVEAYMRPDRETASQVLAAKDPQQFAKMHALMTDLAQHNHSVVMSRVDAERDLKVKKEQAQEVHERADRLSTEADADLAEATRLRDRQAAVRDELDHRITNLKGESEDLEAQEAQLSALIEARHKAVPVEAPEPTVPVATTAAPTTSAPTTTIAGPTTTAKPGTPTTQPPPTTSPTTPPTSPPTTKPPGAPSLQWPVIGPVTSPFGARWGTFHKGIDIGVPEGTPIHAAAAGTVFFSGEISGYGNCILIDHGKGMVTLYAHQSQLIAAQGAYVTAGTVIGLVGSTGHSTGPHLHFEVRINNVAVDPMGYLP